MAWVSKPSVQHIRTTSVVEQPAAAYFAWVDANVPGVQVVRHEDAVHMHVFGSGQPAISLQRTSDSPATYRVTGGFFVARPAGGELVFAQQNVGELEIALRGFTPRLPRAIFLVTHSLVHEAVMWSFKRHVEIPALEHDPT